MWQTDTAQQHADLELATPLFVACLLLCAVAAVAAPPAGASALDKRSAKAFKAAMLAKLGAAADKRPRIPAKVGGGWRTL